MSDDPESIPYSAVAVEHLAAQYAEPLLQFVLRHHFPRQRAEELVQDAFYEVIKSWQQRPLSEPQRKLYITAKQRMANEWRRLDRKPTDLIEDFEQIVETATALLTTQFETGLVARIDVVQALRELPHRQHAVLALRFGLKLETKIVAELLGCSVDDVKYAQSVGLRQLRRSPHLAGYMVKPKPEVVQ